MKCSLRGTSAEDLMNVDDDLIYSGTISALLFKHGMDELFELLGVDRLRRYAVLHVQDG